MTAANFPACLKFVLREEGGNDDDPHDHGGRTSRGIIQREWDAWRADHPGNDWPTDVWVAPQDQIEAIYREQYWEPYCDRMPAGVDLEFFDFSVNAGRGQAVRSLQKALGVAVDGTIGVVTWGAIGKADLHQEIDSYADARRSFYRALAQFPRYGKGWLARAARCQELAEKMAGHPAPVPAPQTVPQDESPKANPSDRKKPPVVTPRGGTIVTGGAGGLIEILNQFRQQIEGYAGAIQYVEYVLFGIAVISVGLTLYGFWHDQARDQGAAVELPT